MLGSNSVRSSLFFLDVEMNNRGIMKDYIPQDLFERGGTNSKQVSRTLEVCIYAQCHFRVSISLS